jgi:hypothetical protein
MCIKITARQGDTIRLNILEANVLIMSDEYKSTLSNSRSGLDDIATR